MAGSSGPTPQRATRSSRGLYLIAAVHLVLMGLFFPLRYKQLSLPDPYNNPYTDWSTLCLTSGLVLWLVAVGIVLWRVCGSERVPLLVWLWFVPATLFGLWFVWLLLRFVGI